MVRCDCSVASVARKLTPWLVVRAVRLGLALMFRTPFDK